MGLVTGPLWGRKAWGVWWQWDARLTIALLLELIFVAYCWCGSTAGRARRSSRPRRRSSAWPTCRSSTSRSTSGGRSIRKRASCRAAEGVDAGAWAAVLAQRRSAFVLLSTLLMMLRVNLAKRQAALDELYLAYEES